MRMWLSVCLMGWVGWMAACSPTPAPAPLDGSVTTDARVQPGPGSQNCVRVCERQQSGGCALEAQQACDTYCDNARAAVNGIGCLSQYDALVTCQMGLSNVCVNVGSDPTCGPVFSTYAQCLRTTTDGGSP